MLGAPFDEFPVQTPSFPFFSSGFSLLVWVPDRVGGRHTSRAPSTERFKGPAKNRPNVAFDRAAARALASMMGYDGAAF